MKNVWFIIVLIPTIFVGIRVLKQARNVYLQNGFWAVMLGILIFIALFIVTIII